MNEDKINLDLDILKHQPGDICEEPDLSKRIPGLLPLPLRTKGAAIGKTDKISWRLSSKTSPKY